MYYLLILVLLFLAELFYFRVADRLNIIDRPNERSSHTRITLRGGGIIFYFGALAYFVTNGFEYPRLLFHFSAMALMFWQWDLLSLGWGWLILALVVCTGIINAYNFMDGINGITGGYSLVALATLAYANGRPVAFVESDLIYTVMLSVAVFCFFNFRSRARCFAGDVGSVSIAFIVLFLLGKLVIATGDLSWIVLLAVYGVDSVLTIVHRLLLHENIGLPHRKHLYQLMANELRIPHVTVSLVYMTVQGLVNVGYLACPSEYGYMYLAGTVVVLSGVYVWFMKKYFRLHAFRS